MIQVVVGIIIKNNKILIVKRKYIENNLEWQFPGGKVEETETESEAIEREIMEETDIEVNARVKIGERFHPETHVLISYWACDYIHGIAKINRPNEVMEVRWVNKEALLNYFTTELFEPVSNYINDY